MLTIREYEADFRQCASDLQLVERVFRGGIEGNQLRAALWPLILGLVKERGRFVRKTNSFASINGHSSGGGGSSTSMTNGYHNGLTNGHHIYGKTVGNGLLSNGSLHRRAAGNGLTLSSSSPAFLSTSEVHRRRAAAVAAAAASGKTTRETYVYIEHESNLRRWRDLERQYRSYESQWKSIQPEQELRFSVFRERKALIERDVIRSDRSHPFYAGNSANLKGLTTLLMTYMMYDFDIGYLQGMSDIAAPILYVYQGDLVKSFWVFVEIMKLFRRNFEHSQKTIHFQLNCLYRLIKLTDAKLARHLRNNECSNCFFVFRCIVCLFKRELMKGNRKPAPSNGVKENNGGLSDGLASSAGSCSSSSAPSSAASSSAMSEDGDHVNEDDIDDDDEELSSPDYVRQVENNYNRVLNLWDTIWCVQRRHELLARSKCVHTFTIANGKTNKTSPSSNRNQRQTKSTAPINITNGKQRPSKRNNTPSPLSTSSSNGNFTPTLPHGCCCSPRRPSTPAPIKQEQIVYTKETFYSSFDPNQADTPRFELTETEKFILSLCMSLIRRERDKILINQMDASEIHQHFINLQLAYDFDAFLEQAYEVYGYLNTDCDLKLLVKGANELAGEAANSDLSSPIGADEHLPETADTYELLRDYLIISPTAYNISMTSLNNLNQKGSPSPTTLVTTTPLRTIRRESSSRYSVSQKSWDHFLNSETLQ